jgi:hypothetical protein
MASSLIARSSLPRVLASRSILRATLPGAYGVIMCSARRTQASLQLDMRLAMHLSTSLAAVSVISQVLVCIPC